MRQLIFTLILLTNCLRMQAQSKDPQTVSPALLKALQGSASDTLLITAQLEKGVVPEGAIVVERYVPANVYTLRIAVGDARRLIDGGSVVFAGLKAQAREELNTGFLDLSLNRINLVHARYPTLRGDSLRVVVKEQSFDTSDIDLATRVFATGRAANTSSAHASIMATIIGGAGNSAPTALGVAPAAQFGSVSFTSLLPEPDSFYRAAGISVENHSYGTGVENFYGAEAAAYDAAARNNLSLQFVFSAGNSGTANAASGIYAGRPVSNLTGNFKHAKNVLVVGATDSLGVLEAASSRGPAYDGRVKPELTAFGQDGSSGAAALVSGSALLVQQAFRNREGQLPPSALVRAALVNAAEDAGPPQVDYRYGYGRLNAYDAVRTMTEGRYAVDSLPAAAQRDRTITVVAGTGQLRVTLAWTDLPASAGARALVNDLDLQVLAPGGTVWRPWVLRAAPDSIAEPARRAVDTLNNIEQVTIDDPAPGIYTVRVSGSRVAGTQAYALAWQADTSGRFEWSFPAAGDALRPGRNLLRWFTRTAGTGDIDYQFNGGPWQLLASNVSLAAGAFAWQAPDSFALVRFRLRSAGLPDRISDEGVLGAAPVLTTGFNCADSFLLVWNRQAVTSWQLYELTGAYLQPFRISTDTLALLRKQQHPSLYYAVAPLVGGKPAARSLTVKYDAQGVECYFRNFYLNGQSGNTAQFTAGVGTLNGIASVSLQRLGPGGYADRQTVVPAAITFLLSDSALNEGVNRYRLRIRLLSGADVFSDPIDVYSFGATPVLVFPNPAAAGAPVNILAREAGRYSVQVVDALGRVLFTRSLNGLNTPVAPFVLPAGLYFVRVLEGNTLLRTQKLVVL